MLQNVAGELETRRDIYGYDLLAWALHGSGRDAEARAPMAQALALGTRDAMLLLPRRHDRSRHRRLGGGRIPLRAALAINPSWHPTQPARRGRCWTPSRARPAMSELLAFMHLGFRHITDPAALDHILFLLALAAIYRGRDWRDVLWVVTAFTVGPLDHARAGRDRRAAGCRRR